MSEIIETFEKLMAETKSIINERDEYIKTISDLKAELEEAYARIKHIEKVCSNIKDGKNAQIVALDKEVDALKKKKMTIELA